MSKRISLREFQENLAKRLAEASTSEHRSLLGVQIGNENWLLDLPDAGEIMPPPPLAPVPLTSSWYRGLVNVRGTLYSVIDMARFHDEALTAPSGQARLLLIGARHNVHSAILVSRILGLRGKEDFETDHGDPDPRAWVEARLRDAQNHPWVRLNVPKLLASSNFLNAGTNDVAAPFFIGQNSF
jgi:twitching motility protein PilI